LAKPESEARAWQSRCSVLILVNSELQQTSAAQFYIAATQRH